MAETIAKNKVQVFPKPEWIEAGCAPSACAGCGSSCEEPPEGAESLEDVISGFQQTHVAKYDGEAAIGEAITSINQLLEDGGEEIRVDPDSFEVFMSHAAPLVAINGMFAFIGGTPTSLELSGVFEMVTTGKE